MSYKCKLTSLNKQERKSAILELYLAAKVTHSARCFCFVLLLVYEYICSYYFIDTDEEVSLRALLRKVSNFNSFDVMFINILKDLRDEIAHNNVNTNDSSFVKQIVRLYNIIDNITVFSVFENDLYNYKTLFTDCCVALQHSATFNAEQFLRSYYGAKYDLLPIASVNDCKTMQDCLMLIKELENIL